MSDFKAKINADSISAGAPPQTPLGELTSKGSEGRGGDRREGRGEEVSGR